MNVCRASLHALAIIALSACSAPLLTRVNPPVDTSSITKSEGLVYRLPLKAIIVTLTVEPTTNKRSVQIAASSAYPDLRTRLIAEYNNSQLSSDDVSIATDVNGLLSGDSSVTKTSQVDSVLSGLASAVGAFDGSRLGAHIPDAIITDCSKPGSYSWLIEPGNEVTRGEKQTNDIMKPCKLSIKLDILGDLPEGQADKSRVRLTSGLDGDTRPGLFYRQALPYLVRTSDDSGNGQVTATLLALPTRESPIEFLPIKKSLFAKSVVKFNFSEGSPKLFDQQLESEWVGLFSLPADIVKSYFTAVGAVFSQRQGAMQNEANYLAEVNALAVQQLKTQACLNALTTKEDTKIQAACGK